MNCYYLIQICLQVFEFLRSDRPRQYNFQVEDQRKTLIFLNFSIPMTDTINKIILPYLLKLFCLGIVQDFFLSVLFCLASPLVISSSCRRTVRTYMAFRRSLYSVRDCGTLCLDCCVTLATTLLALDIIYMFSQTTKCIQRIVGFGD